MEVNGGNNASCGTSCLAIFFSGQQYSYMIYRQQVTNIVTLTLTSYFLININAIVKAMYTNYSKKSMLKREHFLRIRAWWAGSRKCWVM